MMVTTIFLQDHLTVYTTDEEAMKLVNHAEADKRHYIEVTDLDGDPWMIFPRHVVAVCLRKNIPSEADR